MNTARELSTTDNMERVPANFRDRKFGVDQLRRVALFRNFTESELAALYEIGKVKSTREGVHVVIEGEPSQGLYLVLKGTLSIYKSNSSTGNLNKLTSIEAPSHFGELSLFDSAPRSASVSGDTDCVLFYLDRSAFEQYLAADPGNLSLRFYKTCAQDLAERFRKLNSDYITSQQLLWTHALQNTEKKS